MLKIKEDEMKDLEIIGFKKDKVWGNDVLVYDFTPYTKIQSSYLVIQPESRELIFSYVDFFSNTIECFDLIFDLIKADMVEKVVEDEKKN